MLGTVQVFLGISDYMKFGLQEFCLIFLFSLNLVDICCFACPTFALLSSGNRTCIFLGYCPIPISVHVLHLPSQTLNPKPGHSHWSRESAYDPNLSDESQPWGFCWDYWEKRLFPMGFLKDRTEPRPAIGFHEEKACLRASQRKTKNGRRLIFTTSTELEPSVYEIRIYFCTLGMY